MNGSTVPDQFIWKLATSTVTKDAAVARSVDFRHLWRQLRAVGWTSKRLTRLDTEWIYYAPNRDSHELVEGTKTFTGEDAVVRYAISSGLINLDESSDENGEEPDENVRPSQIDCSLMLSTPTLDALFDGISDADKEIAGADTEVTAPTVDTAQQPSGQIELSDEDVVVGAFQRMLAEAESEGHVHLSDNESKHDDSEHVEKSPPGPR
ncbi:hypothetical protein F442_13130 [Phytophthora nicotianae P10297]|uniref:Uncharacterized protein n=1 Tax=Phytophthora nicotianae P10297 TaxID=1317064 RepID=W2YX66_PHYNI|nr:hypothetical protein F442_13130 [Phytophthora nicotianae P10297]